jgi:16S rRNA (uracil1498-N3)-methyltransferase
VSDPLFLLDELADPLPALGATVKAARDELAVEMLTELGVQEIVPWQAQRSVVRWLGDRSRNGLACWRSTVREAAKQSRRLHVPVVREPVRTVELTRLVGEVDLALVLHEGATHSLRDVELPQGGTIMIVIGPEGGIASAELDALVATGARPVLVSDGVLRTSTAGVVALAGLLYR